MNKELLLKLKHKRGTKHKLKGYKGQTQTQKDTKSGSKDG